MKEFFRPDILILFGLWLLGFLYLVRIGCRRYERVHRCHWYDQSDRGPNEEMDWCQIRLLMKDDPLNFHKTSKNLCRYSCKLVLFDFSCIFAFILIFGGSLNFIYHLTSLDDASCCTVLNEYLRLKEIGKNSNLNQVGAIVAGAATLIAAIITVIYQIRLQARSKNRQNWINSIREEMTVLMTNFPTYDASESEIEKAQQDTRANFTRLSLNLNPVERVHRGFLTIVRYMYRIDGLKEDETPRKKLGLPESSLHEQQINCEPQDIRSQQEAWSTWNSRTMRLANILLKREWEQVKHVK